MSSVNNAWSKPGSPIPSRDCYSVLRPVTCFYRIAGVFPLSLKGLVGQRKYSTNYALLIYSIVVHAVILADLLLLTGSSLGRAKKFRNKTLVQTGITVQLVMQIISTVVTSASVILTREKLANVMNGLCAQDEALRKLGIRFDYAAEFKKSCIRLGMIISIIIILFTYDFFYQFESNLRDPLNWIAWTCSNILRIISTCFFADMITVLMQRLSAVNESLRKTIHKLRDAPLETMSGRLKICSRIHSIAIIHGDLCKFATTLNHIFGVNIVVAVIFALTILTTVMYYVVKEIKNPERSYGRMYGLVNWGMISSIHIIYIVMVCITARSQANLTGKLITKLSIPESDAALNSAIQSLSIQLCHRNINFTGAGLFPLDATLVRSIVGAVTTYLVIIMQFDTVRTQKTSSTG